MFISIIYFLIMQPGTVLEFFSGIGGWHFAFHSLHDRKEDMKLPDQVTAIEININSNEVYKRNFPDVKIISKDIKHIPTSTFSKIHANTWVLSPPCQPYTSLGKQKGGNDNTVCSAVHGIFILKQSIHAHSGHLR